MKLDNILYEYFHHLYLAKGCLFMRQQLQLL
jgi:hypothetical protein